MDLKLKAQYNSLYSTHKNFFGGGEPLEIIKNISKYIKAGTVLDIGGGEGRNAIYLAQKGFDVTVYDISEIGIKNLKESIKDLNLNIKTKVIDVTKEKLEGTYDLILNNFVMHHLSTKESIKLITESQEHTNKNGVHIVTTFSNKGKLYERNKKSERFYPSLEVIKDIYKDWYIKDLFEEEILTYAKDKKGERIKNFVVNLIAVK